MSTIRFKEANCRNCYKCIRSCPVKAISFKNEQAQIMEQNCVLCGKCLQVCPQNAKSVVDDLDKVKEFIKNNEKVYLSLAPSYPAEFDVKGFRQMAGALRKLGFTYVEETALGAAKVSMEYEKLIRQGDMKNIISTACPVIVSLVEKYYPELIEQLAPVVSPMIAHVKMMREIYGSEGRMVFIGPCLAKKEEYKDFVNDNLIDAVLTFEELQRWMDMEGIVFDEDNDMDAGEELVSRFYPVPGGILKTLKGDSGKYRYISIDGTEQCMKALESIKSGRVSNYFIEMNSCSGGCVNGPCIKSLPGGLLEAKDRIFRSAEKFTAVMDYNSVYHGSISFTKKFYDKSKPYDIPDDDTIREILKKIGKFSTDDELNCGGCGYSSCREKAIAVYNNKAELHMCLPYMRERAESISNIIINSTPNAIIALDRKLNIQEMNSAATDLFNLNGELRIGESIHNILDCPEFEIVRDTGKDILNRKCRYESFDITVEQSILHAKEHDTIIIIMKNITEEEKQRQYMQKMRCETAEVAQKVIEKQMMVAQEIASLLGETTAETKVALTKLRDSIISRDGENQ